MIQDVYIKMDSNMDVNVLEERLRTTYSENESIRYILDTCDSSLSPSTMNKFKAVFDKFKKEEDQKLKETFIITDSKLKKMMLKSYITVFNNNNNINII